MEIANWFEGMIIEEIYDYKVIYMRRTGQYGVENYKLMCMGLLN